MEIYKALETKSGVVLTDPDTNKVLEVSANIVRHSVRRKAAEAGQLIAVDDEQKVRRVHPNRLADLRKAGVEAAKRNFRSERENGDPNQMFTNLELLTKMVGRGIQPSLIVSGMAGMGKTHIVKETLRSLPNTSNRSGKFEESKDFIHIKGRAGAGGLYVTLYENANKTIIFDDCDSIYSDSDAVNVLKAALDSYDTRTIHYITSKPLKDSEGNKVPNNFEFKGKVIFITNRRQDQIDPAIRSRSFVTDISLTVPQMFERIEELMETMEKKIPMKAKREAFDILKELYKEYQNVHVNIRTFIKVARICALGFPNPKQMAAEQICIN